MANTQSVQFDVLRSVAHGSISGTYAAVGAAFAEPIRVICFTNNTDGDMFFAVTNGSIPASDGTADNLFVAANSFKLFDLNTNKLTKDNEFVLAINTQVFVRQSTAPTKNSVYVECVWGK